MFRRTNSEFTSAIFTLLIAESQLSGLVSIHGLQVQEKHLAFRPVSETSSRFEDSVLLCCGAFGTEEQRHYEINNF